MSLRILNLITKRLTWSSVPWSLTSTRGFPNKLKTLCQRLLIASWKCTIKLRNNFYPHHQSLTTPSIWGIFGECSRACVQHPLNILLSWKISWNCGIMRIWESSMTDLQQPKTETIWRQCLQELSKILVFRKWRKLSTLREFCLVTLLKTDKLKSNPTFKLKTWPVW